MIGSQNCPLRQFSGSAEPIPAPDSDAARMGVAARMAMAARCGFRMSVILPGNVGIKGPDDRGCGWIQIRQTRLDIMWLIGTNLNWADEADPGFALSSLRTGTLRAAPGLDTPPRAAPGLDTPPLLCPMNIQRAACVSGPHRAGVEPAAVRPESATPRSQPLSHRNVTVT